MLIFGVPKASTPHLDIIQYNAVESWKRAGRSIQVMLVGNDRGVAELAATSGVQHYSDVRTTKQGTPLLSSAFERAQGSGESTIVYVNSDIILPPFFQETVERVRSKYFLVVGQRVDVDIISTLKFNEELIWYKRLSRVVDSHGILHRRDGIDFFAFTVGLFDPMPDFAVGRPAFDNWLIYRALDRKACVIDATRVFRAIHQNHDYSHAGGREPMVTGEEALLNRKFAGDMLCDLDDANYILTRFGEIPKVFSEVAWQRWCRRNGVRWGPRATPLGVLYKIVGGRFRW